MVFVKSSKGFEPMTEPVLKIDQLSVTFTSRDRDVPAVQDFSAQVMPGETLGLVGESGCGKSTVALAIMQDLGTNGRISGGRILFRGRDLRQMSKAELRDLRGKDIAMIYQEPTASLNPALKVGEQLMEVPRSHDNLSKNQARERALAMIEDVQLPDPRRIMDSYPHQLSGGQQQRIVIAMALMSEPSLLILDEPTTALDVTVEAAIVQLISELGRKHGTSMVFISHNLGLVLETCDRLCVMYSGEAVETGAVREVFDGMRHPYTEALFRSIPHLTANKTERPLQSIPGNFPLPYDRPPGCNFGPRCRYFQEAACNSGPIQMSAIQDRSHHFTRCARVDEIAWGQTASIKSKSESPEAGRPILKVEGLKKYYSIGSPWWSGGRKGAQVVKANESISFDAYEGETLAIVGESGCGKSTLARLLLGLDTPTGGRIILDGCEIHNLPIEARTPELVSAIQMVFQNPADTLNPSMSVARQIIRSLEIFGIGDSDAERHARMLDLLELVKLPKAFADRKPSQLSGGQKQRVGIARAIAGNARIVVADEPVSALDVSVQASVANLLMDIQREKKTTLLFISHDLGVVRYLSDRVMVMYLGQVMEMGTTEQVFSPPFHPYTEALIAAAPSTDTNQRVERTILKGDLPSATSSQAGCPFQTRCPLKSSVEDNRCETELPATRDLGDGHVVKCHLLQ